MKSDIDSVLRLPIESVNKEIYDLYENYLANSHKIKVFEPISNGDVSKVLLNMLDGKPKGPDRFFEILEGIVLKHSMNLQNPMYMGHQVPPTLPLAVVTDLIVNGLNQSLAVNKMSPVMSEIERQLIYFLCMKIGYSKNAGGTMTSGGSISNLLGVLAARKKHFPDYIPDNAVILTSEQCHFSIAKAANVLGFPKKSLMTSPCDKDYKIEIDKLIEKINSLKEEGKQPFLIAANSGSTSTGSFDDIEKLSHIAAEYNMWLHIDGAHGSSLIFSDKLRTLIHGIEKADSISWDGHKMMYMPSSTAMCLFKNNQDLKDCFKEDQAPYLYNSKETELDLSKLSIQCTRRGDALKLWGSLVAYGVNFFAERLEHVTDVTQYFYKRLVEHNLLEPLHKPQFNIICFRYNPNNKLITEDELNKINLYIRDSINETGELMITLTSLNNTVSLRCTIINPATNYEHIDRLISIIEDHIPE